MAGFEQWLKPIQKPLQLFRDGGFGTIDEFCFHIRDARPEIVSRLKQVLQLVFGIHGPERGYAKSDYYRFIQRLFKPDRLADLREDIIVMSFNYDPYLEWLLRRAIHTRRIALTESHAKIDPSVYKTEALITSGFAHGALGVKAITDDDAFCVLKLHGTAAWPYRGSETQDKMIQECCFDRFFDQNIANRLKYLTPTEIEPEVPIIFPWEIINSDGTFYPKESFKLKDPIHDHDTAWRTGGRQATDPSTHEIFTSVWTRAREEVLAAKKISFVGLSLHEYLNFGFKYLFDGKQGEIDLVVTDRHSRQNFGQNAIRADLNPLSPGAKALKLLQRYSPAVKANAGTTVILDRGVTKRRYRSEGDAVRLRLDFEEFITEELG